jgi:hypothetical protein
MQNVTIKKLACKGTLRQVFFWEAKNSLTLLYTLYTVRVYSILIYTGKRGGGLNQREG